MSGKSAAPGGYDLKVEEILAGNVKAYVRWGRSCRFEDMSGTASISRSESQQQSSAVVLQRECIKWRWNLRQHSVNALKRLK